MSYINNLHDLMHRQLNVEDIPKLISEQSGCGIEEATELAKKMSFMDYHRLMEGDNPFGSFSKPGEQPGNTNDDERSGSGNSNQLNIDPDDLEMGDVIDYMTSDGHRTTGKIKDAPDAAGRMKVVPDDGRPEISQPLEITLGDVVSPDDAELQNEIQRLQKLAGIGGQVPDKDMEECATGGGTGAGAVASAATGRINPHSRKHSPHGKAFKSARSKTSEYKRTLSKRGPKI